jgi:hypothetical protein
MNVENPDRVPDTTPPLGPGGRYSDDSDRSSPSEAKFGLVPHRREAVGLARERTESTMSVLEGGSVDEEVFNISVRRFLKKLGVTAQLPDRACRARSARCGRLTR